MQAQFNQASAYHKSGQLDQAEAIYRELLVSEPGHPALLARMATLMQQKHQPGEALVYIEQAIKASSGDPQLLHQGFQIASQAGRNDLAERWLRPILEQQPENGELIEQLAGVLIGNHKEKEALSLLKEAIKTKPQSASAYNLKGLAMSRLGDSEKGYKNFQKSVKLNPGQLGAVKNLLTYGKGKKEPILDQLIPQLEQKLRQKGLPAVAMMNMAYVVSMYYEKKKVAKKAFEFLKMGNDINRRSYQYAHSDTVNHFEQIKQAWNGELRDAMKEKGIADASPIFILGMPRSGTTLIEQILSSHSKVEAEGEILDLKAAFEPESKGLFSRDTSDKVSANIRAAKNYIESVRQRNQAEFFTDKLPYNFIMIGLIALAMPNTKIIHCTRDPVETCFSIYKQNFSGTHPYKNDLKELGAYYNEYQSLMTHWNELLPGRIYEANYETMVDNSEAEIARLLEHCGLEMESACLGFHKNKRAVRTASVAQVRQPIYKDAKKASSAFTEMLKPLIDTLNGKAD